MRRNESAFFSKKGEIASSLNYATDDRFTVPATVLYAIVFENAYPLRTTCRAQNREANVGLKMV